MIQIGAVKFSYVFFLYARDYYWEVLMWSFDANISFSCYHYYFTCLHAY